MLVDTDGDAVDDHDAVIGAAAVVNIYFTADCDVDGTTLEGFFCLPIQVGVPAVEVTVDIKPGSCPTPLNPTSNGVLRVAVAGSDEFDATPIDLSTVVMTRADGVGGAVAPNEGPPGPHSTFQDHTAPQPGEPCDCEQVQHDGITDLSLKFRTDDLAQELELDALAPGQQIELCVSGLTLDATPFAGFDCAWIVPPGGVGGTLTVESIFEYIDVFYNRKRKHSTLGYVSPVEFEMVA